MSERLTLKFEGDPQQLGQLGSGVSMTVELRSEGPRPYIDALMAFMVAVGFVHETVVDMVLDKAEELDGGPRYALTDLGERVLDERVAPMRKMAEKIARQAKSAGLDEKVDSERFGPHICLAPFDEADATPGGN